MSGISNGEKQWIMFTQYMCMYVLDYIYTPLFVFLILFMIYIYIYVYHCRNSDIIVGNHIYIYTYLVDGFNDFTTIFGMVGWLTHAFHSGWNHQPDNLRYQFLGLKWDRLPAIIADYPGKQLDDRPELY